MSLVTFNPDVPPSASSTFKADAKVYKADFGDGYSQYTGANVLNRRYTLTLQWDILTPDQKNSICGFFENRKGFERFYYQPNDEITRIWVCEDWSARKIEGGFWEMQATLVEQISHIE